MQTTNSASISDQRTLVGTGAQSFAARNGVPVLDETSFDKLVSPDARDLWLQWSARLQSAEEDPESLNLGAKRTMQDTVGAVAIYGENVAAGVSRCHTTSSTPMLRDELMDEHSGGILLKLPGRMGEVSVGTGSIRRRFSCCRRPLFTARGVGRVATLRAAYQVRSETHCCFTARLTQDEGTGEDIVRSALARTLCEEIQQRGTDSTHEALEEVLQHKFVGT